MNRRMSLVVTAATGIALAVDAVSFFAAAAILGRIRIAPRATGKERTGFFHELRDG